MENIKEEVVPGSSPGKIAPETKFVDMKVKEEDVTVKTEVESSNTTDISDSTECYVSDPGSSGWINPSPDSVIRPDNEAIGHETYFAERNVIRPDNEAIGHETYFAERNVIGPENEAIGHETYFAQRNARSRQMSNKRSRHYRRKKKESMSALMQEIRAQEEKKTKLIAQSDLLMQQCEKFKQFLVTAFQPGPTISGPAELVNMSNNLTNTENMIDATILNKKEDSTKPSIKEKELPDEENDTFDHTKNIKHDEIKLQEVNKDNTLKQPCTEKADQNVLTIKDDDIKLQEDNKDNNLKHPCLEKAEQNVLTIKDDIILQEDKHSCLEKVEQNDIAISEKNISCLENIATKSTSKNEKQLLCSVYSNSDSDSEDSLKTENKGILCSMYSDSESEESVEKENIEENVISVFESQCIDKKLLKNEPKKVTDSQSSSNFSSKHSVNSVDSEPDNQNVDNDLKTSTVTKSNSKDLENGNNQESSLSALTNKKIEVEHHEIENQNCNMLKDVDDLCVEPVNKLNTESNVSDNQVVSKESSLNYNEKIEKDTSTSFIPSEDTPNSSTAEEIDDKIGSASKETDELYEEFSKLIEEEINESSAVESVIENKIEKTCTINLENIVFRDFSTNLSDLKSTVGFKPVEKLQDFDVSITEWATLLVSQLSVRDELIGNLHNCIEKLVQKGTALEQDVDYQQIKITELQQQIQKKKRKRKNKLCQNTDKQLLNSSKIYSKQSVKEYPHSFPLQGVQKDQWPTHYEAQASVVHSSVLQQSNIEKASVVTDHIANKVVDEKENLKKDANESICNDKLKYDISSAKYENKESTSIESFKDFNVKNNVEKKKTQDNNTNFNSSVSNNNSNEISQTLTEESQDQPTEPISISGTEDLVERDSWSWDKSKNIADQVAAAATQIVDGSGYVFDQESGLYYDHNSGYYYNAETGLYYDSNSGTYFYYDHSTQAYQFHSQVVPENSENKPRKKNKRKRKNLEDKLTEDSNISGDKHPPIKKKKCKIKREGDEEKEDGECSESEGSSDGLDEVLEEEEEESEEEMETEVTGDIHGEEYISQSEVPPSLRLMVIESEAKRVNVGSLHMVTVDGGTAGREKNNIVHLQDISISKIHAGFSFYSNGPSDFHYYVRDLGSNNGTFVNAIRLSEPRQESQKKELGHGWLLRLGQVTLKCHIHPGSLTCNECEPGLVAKTSNNKKEGSGYKSAKSREKARKKEMKAIRKKYALSWADEPPPQNSDYKDRAENRRHVIGSDNPYEKTEVASADIAIPKKNKGFKMLEKMGWAEGQGLGKTTTGLIEPIQPDSSVGRSGLGCIVTPIPETTSAQANRKKILSITQNRYNKF